MFHSTTVIIVSFTFFILSDIHLICTDQIDFKHVWFQHTNQVVYLYDQLSNPKDIAINPNQNESNLCRSSMQQLVHDAKDGQFYANKSKWSFFIIPVAQFLVSNYYQSINHSTSVQPPNKLPLAQLLVSL